MNTELTKDEIELITNVVPENRLMPSNMPKLEQISQWETMIGRWYYKKNAKDGQPVKGIFFEPVNLFPSYPDNKEKYTVVYTFNVRLHFGAVKGPDGKPMTGKLDKLPIVKLAKIPDSNNPIDQMIPVEQFLKDYIEAK